MSLFESIIYGFVSGLSEFLPVSSQGHQALLLRLFGQDHRDPVRDFFVHIALIFALLFACKSVFTHLRREYLLSKRRHRHRRLDRKGLYDLRLIKTTIIPMMLCMLLYLVTKPIEFKPLSLALFFLINGIVIIIPEYMAHGNKDSRHFTVWDGIVLGLTSLLSSIPGISRIGSMSAYMTARGADRQNALNWILVLSLPALIMLSGLDIVNLIVQGFDPFNFIVFLGYLIAAASAFAGGYLGIMFLRYLTVQIGYAGFAYYSWGTAMFSFILYLIV